MAENDLTFHHGCRFAFLYFQRAWNKTTRCRGGGKRRSPWLQIHSRIDGQRAAVRLWLTPWLSVSLQWPQMSPVNYLRKKTRKRKKREERRGGGKPSCRSELRLKPWMLRLLLLLLRRLQLTQPRMLRGREKASRRKKNKRGRAGWGRRGRQEDPYVCVFPTGVGVLRRGRALRSQLTWANPCSSPRSHMVYSLNLLTPRLKRKPHYYPLVHQKAVSIN